jgi:hypothetical protein
MAEINREKENNLLHKVLLDTLEYSPTLGTFTNKVKRPGIALGKVMGTKLSNNYIAISVRGPKFLAHRLAWFYTHASWPICYIDHIDRNRSNNAISNLREASEYENVHNIKVFDSNTSGFTGVRKMGNKWQARVQYKGEDFHLGTYCNIEEANIARIKFKEEFSLL